MPFFLGTFKIQRKINTVQIFCIKYLFCWSAAKIFYFPSQEGQNGAPLVEKSVSLVLQVARNCRLTEVGKRFMPRSYALALASGEHDCWLVEENGGGGLAGGDCNGAGLTGGDCIGGYCWLTWWRRLSQEKLQAPPTERSWAGASWGCRSRARWRCSLRSGSDSRGLGVPLSRRGSSTGSLASSSCWV